MSKFQPSNPFKRAREGGNPFALSSRAAACTLWAGRFLRRKNPFQSKTVSWPFPHPEIRRIPPEPMGPEAQNPLDSAFLPKAKLPRLKLEV